MTKRGVPEFAVSTRGIVYFHLTVRTGERDPAFGCLRRRCVERGPRADADRRRPASAGRRLPEPLRAGITAPTDEERAAWRQLTPGPQLLGGAGAQLADPKAGEEFYPRTTAEPAVDVNGVVGGSPILQKTVLPVFAEANLSIRLAPGQDVDTITAAAQELMRAAAPEGAELEIARLAAAPAGLVSLDAPALQLGLDAFEQAMGKRPLLVRSGGTLPIVPALVDKGIPTILSGFALPESNIHSPNERPARRIPPPRDRDGQGAVPKVRGARALAVVDEPLVAEAAHLVDDRQQRLALLGQLVLDARW
jgi:hypothetical protein